jgi:hypothetical protein
MNYGNDTRRTEGDHMEHDRIMYRAGAAIILFTHMGDAMTAKATSLRGGGRQDRGFCPHHPCRTSQNRGRVSKMMFESVYFRAIHTSAALEALGIRTRDRATIPPIKQTNKLEGDRRRDRYIWMCSG